jgi:MFS transporter, PAT family, beta-lactamase induction signal transducer AmpG
MHAGLKERSDAGTPATHAETAPRRELGPGSWIPTAYIAEGIPFAIVIWVAGTMFKDLGHSDTEITLGTASVGIVWSLKPLWAPFLDMVGSKRRWVLAMQAVLCLLLAGLSGSLGLASYFHVAILVLWVVAFASATQDICIDGVYITTLGEKAQASWIGVQGMSWNVGRIFGTALVVWTAGAFKTSGLDARTAWSYALALSAAMMGALGIYHSFVLPAGSPPRRPRGAAEVFSTFVDAWKDFLQKPSIAGMLTFVFLFRLGEGFLLVEAPLFMQAPLEAGGLGLTLGQKAFVDGTVSTVVSIIGGLLGGRFVAKMGLQRSLLILAICINVPHLSYLALSLWVSPTHPLSLHAIQLLVSAEKLGYSFGFVGNMLYIMQQLAPGRFKMTHYAFGTALMNLVLVPTQMLSGPLADWLGYRGFFALVLLASVPSVWAAWRAPFPRSADMPYGSTP